VHTTPGYETQPGATCVELAALEGLLKKLDKKGIVTLDTSGYRLNLTVGKIKATLPTLPADEFPQTRSGELGAKIVLDPQEFRKALGRVQTAASTDQARPAMNSIRITSQDETVTLAATDGFRLHYATLPVYKPWDAVCWIYPLQAVKLLDGLLAATEQPVYLQALSHDEDSALKIYSDNWEMFVPLVDAHYPDAEGVTPTQFKHSLIVSREELVEAVETLKSLGGDAITLEVNQALTLTTTQEEGGAIETKLEATDIQGEGELKLKADPDFISAALKVHNGQKVCIQANRPTTPFVLTDPDDTSLKQVIMPRVVD
jgi:DNA polymerase-3 subunit beta